MNTLDLKQELIDRISRIDDVEFLKAIKTILDGKKNESFIKLTNIQEKELLKSSEEGGKGKFISQTELDKKVEVWLSEK